MPAIVNSTPVNIIRVDGQELITPISESFYWAGLDQVRMLAAFAVIFHHIEQTKYIFGWPSLWNCFPIIAAGQEGVRLFFVLSGFLITYLLIKELKKNQTIDIKKFYLRRMLRIWPLYYAVVLGAFFVMPMFLHPPAAGTQVLFFQSQLQHHFLKKLALFTFFLPNVCLDKYPPVLFAAQCWSLGMEWQIYLICPFIFLLFRRFILSGILAALTIKPSLLWSINLLANQQHENMHFFNLLQTLKQSVFNFESEPFIAEAIAAWCMLKYPHFVKKMALHPLTCVFFVTAIAACFLGDFPWRIQLITASFTLLVLSFAHRVLNFGFLTGATMYLGYISYGLYMLHPAVLTFAAQVLSNTHFSLLQKNVAIYLLTIIVTILAASISYKFFERPFLQLKNGLAVIKTSEQQNA